MARQKAGERQKIFLVSRWNSSEPGPRATASQSQGEKMVSGSPELEAQNLSADQVSERYRHDLKGEHLRLRSTIEPESTNLAPRT